MNETDKLVRYRIFQFFLDKARPPTVEELGKAAAIPSSEVENALSRLEELHHLRLYGADTPSPTPIAMIHPFSHLPTPYVVISYTPDNPDGKSWYANCCWCAFGLAAMLAPEPTTINVLTHKGLCTRIYFRNGSLHHVTQENTSIDFDDCWVIFSPPPSKWWNDVRFACGSIQLCLSTEDADSWQRKRGFDKGDKMDLETLWELSKVWYGDKAKYEYDRFSPEEVKALFKRLNLNPDYWNS